MIIRYLDPWGWSSMGQGRLGLFLGFLGLGFIGFRV